MRKLWVLVLLVAIGVLLYIFVTPNLGPSVRRRQDTAFRNLEKRFRSGRNNSYGAAVVEMALEFDPPMDTLMQAVGPTCPNENLGTDSARVLGLIADRRAVGALIQGATSGYRQSCSACIWALGRIGDRQAVGPLIELLEGATRQATAGTSGLLEMETIEALATLGDERAVGPLIARLKACKNNYYCNARFGCENALIRFGLSAVPALVAALGDPDQNTQQAIMEVLGQIGDARAAKPIMDCLGPSYLTSHSQAADPRWEAGLLALARIGTPEALDYLSHCSIRFSSGSNALRAYAAELLARSPESLDAMLGMVAECNPTEAMAKEFVRLKEPRAIPALLRAVGRGIAVEDTLAAIGTPVIEPLQALQAKKRSIESYRVIKILAKIDDPEARWMLWRYVKQKEMGRLRGDALVALANQKDASVIPTARQWLAEGQKNFQLICSAIYALGVLGDRDSIPQIAEVARTPTKSTSNGRVPEGQNESRVAAIKALVTLKAPEAVAVATEAAGEAIKDVRNTRDVHVEAINALAAMKAKESVPTLLRIISDKLPADHSKDYIYLAAVDAIGQLGDGTCWPWLMKLLDQATASKDNYTMREIGIAAADALVRTGAKDTLGPLSELVARWDQSGSRDDAIRTRMPDGSWKDRGTMGDGLCRAIVSSGDPRAFDFLVGALRCKSYSLHLGAVNALAGLGDKRAFDILAGELDAKDSGSSLPCVVDALFKLDAERAVEPLLRWLKPATSTFEEGYVVREIGLRGSPRAAGPLRDKLAFVIFNQQYQAWVTNQHFEYEMYISEMKQRAFLPYALPIAYARCAGKDALPLLVLALRAPANWQMHTGAAEALGELRDRRGIEALIGALNDDAWPVQEAAATSLGQIGDVAAIAALEAAGQHGDRRVRKAARAAIAAIRNPAASTAPVR